MAAVELVERRPSVEEYRRLVAAVGWKARDVEAIAPALAGSLFAVGAEIEGNIVGMGRVIGDGGLHYYLTDVVVGPAHQHRGLGSRIVAALTAYVESVPFKNTWVGLFPVEGTAELYRWLNRSDA